MLWDTDASPANYPQYLLGDKCIAVYVNRSLFYACIFDNTVTDKHNIDHELITYTVWSKHNGKIK